MTATVVQLDRFSGLSSEVATRRDEQGPPRRWVGLRLVAAAAAVALVAYLLAATGIRLDGSASPEATRRDQVAGSAGSADGVARARRAGIDVDGVVNSVRHQVTAVPGRPGELVATDSAYRARFDAAGFALSPTGTHASLGVSLRDAERGGQPLTLDMGAWRGVSNRAERQVAPGVREVVTVGHSEVEWDVVLRSAPSGTGDLVLSADLAGSARVVADGGTLRFGLAGSGELRMGALVVKDATGAVVHRALPRVDGRHLRLVVPHHVLAGARYPLTLDPTVSAEVVVSAATSIQDYSDVAFDGTNYLVVWQDLRSGSFDIWGARVSTAGTVLAPGAFAISTATNDQYYPAVVYYGSAYLVVWEDHRSDPAGDIYGARVQTNGTVLDTGGAAFSTATNDQIVPDLAFDGTNVLVVWEDKRFGQSQIWDTEWSPATGVVSPGGNQVCAPFNGGHDPAVTYWGSTYLVVWEDYRNLSTSGPDIYGARVQTNGVTIDGAGAPFSTAPNAQSVPDLAYDGSTVLVVWEDLRNGSSYDIYGTRFNVTSGVVDPGGKLISSQTDNQQLPKVVANGTFLVVWSDRRSGTNYDIYGTTVAASDAHVDPPAGFAISAAAGDERTPNLTKGNGGNWGVSYDRGPGTNNDGFFRSVAPK